MLREVFRTFSFRTEKSFRSTPTAGPELTDAEPDEVVLCARKAFYVFRRRQQWKALILFSIYFFAYLAYVNLIIDWSRGGETVQLFRQARALAPGINAELDPWCDKSTQMSDHSGQQCWWYYKHMQTVDDLETFLRFRLDKFPASLHEICPSCLVAVGIDTEKVFDSPLDAFTCADLNKKMKPRDCSQVDADWAKNPSILSPPCCSYNSSLVAASTTLRAWYSGDGSVEGAENITVDLLLDAVHEEEAARLAKEHITEHINTNGHVLQVLIFNGFGRAAGIHYQAAWAYGDDKEWSKRSKEEMWAHRLIKTSKSYWSRRWDEQEVETLLLVLCWLGSGASFIHSLAEAWSVCLSKEQWIEWLGSLRTCFCFVTVFFPVFAITGLETQVHPVVWVVLAVITELIMLARFMLEGEVIPACQILIRTIFAAAGQLATLSIVLVIILVVTATLYGQLFGVFMLHSFEDASAAVLNEFANGAELREEAESYNEVGSKLMYFVTMFVLFLTLSQVFITVLMSGFQSARELTREVGLLCGEPEDYVPIEKHFTFGQRFLELAVSGLTEWLPLHGTTQPQVIRALKKAMEELEEAYPELKDRTLGVSQKHLGKCLNEVGTGSKALAVLMAQFGAVRRGEEEQTSKSNLAATSQVSSATVTLEQTMESNLAILRLELLETIRRAQLAPPADDLQRNRVVL